MKLSCIRIILLTITSWLYYIDCSGIDYQVVANSNGVSQFTVLNECFLKLPNHHRFKEPGLKVSIPSSVTIDKVEEKDSSSWILKLKDKSTIDISVKQIGTNVTHWDVVWHGGAQNQNREVCVHYGYNEASWYSTYQSNHKTWPMASNKKLSKEQFGFLHSDAKIEIKNILEYLFVSSDGFALLLDQNSPWFIRIDPNNNDPLLCFSVNNTWPYDRTNQESAYLDIKLHLFASTNIRTVTDFLIHKSTFIPKPIEIPNEVMFIYPTWSSFATNLFAKTQNEIISYASNITMNGFSSYKNDILIDWFSEGSGSSRSMSSFLNQFPDLEIAIATIHKKEFRVGIQMAGYLEMRTTKNQEFYIKHNLDKTHYLDFSNPLACEYWKVLVQQLKLEQKLDSFMFSSFDFFVWTSNFQFHDSIVQKYPSMYTTKFLETAANVGSKYQSTEMGFKTQHLPFFVQIYSYQSIDENFQTLIPNVLSLSIGGYSFISTVSYLSDSPSSEQYIRWVQATALLPGITVQHAPWAFNDPTVVNVTKKFFQLHVEHAPLMIDLAKKRITDGTPIIRPLWYVAPDDPKTYVISDQYMLGEDILVAPVLKLGQRERSVYLPAGEWIDQHGKSYTGWKEFNVPVLLDELAIFKRKHL